MRRMALLTRMKLPSNMAAPGIEPGSRGQELISELQPQCLDGKSLVDSGSSLINRFDTLNASAVAVNAVLI